MRRGLNCCVHVNNILPLARIYERVDNLTVTPERACCDALDAHSSCPRHRRGTHPSRGDRCCWCMVELNQLLQLLPVVSTDQEHCPMLL